MQACICKLGTPALSRHTSVTLGQLCALNSALKQICFASRDVHWSAELLHYAWHNKAKVQAMEAQLDDFANSAQKRRSLPSMPKQERHIMHQLADSYGLATQSFGSEPARHIDVFKVIAWL